MAGCRGLCGVALAALWLAAAAVAAVPRGAQDDPDVIGVPNGGLRGAWAWQDRCPERTYATGFSIKLEAYRGIPDDTALNGIRLHCTPGSRGDRHEARTAESQSGRWGRWLEPAWCPEGTYLQRFSLRVEEPRPGLQDAMGATNVRFACSGGQNLEGRGLAWGEYGAWSPPCTKGLCGIQTKQEMALGPLSDDTALNDVRFFCCTH
ncbi:vitelline membrane outer layer protein 1 homolog [Hemicordylus capensis]|uniref:vitelline membrane outer layer protein 1 homolog n=1 Tax=Hemicordylus capensis TaxID=884348 RepID=UPI0023046006|nr:vitelline membrane outer layer protein 1 homolog [Hemicordylus capensis]